MSDLKPGVIASNALTARWVGAEGERREEFLVSGAAVWPLLAALAAGAAGPARSELEHAVGLSGDSALAAATDVVGTIDRAAGAHVALGLWLREDIALRAAWAAAVPLATRGLLRGRPDEDQVAIDAWVKERTLGIIDCLPVRIGAKTVLMVAACVAIRTRWETQFVAAAFPPPIPSGPWAGRFLYALTGRFEDLDRVSVWDTPAEQLTTFESRGTDDIDVHLVIGSEKSDGAAVLSESIAALSGNRPRRRGSELRTGDTAPGLLVEERTCDDPIPPYVAVQTVAFEVAAQHDLLRRADLFGLRTAADARQGHFPGISEYPLAVQQADQSVRAMFSATGFEAAAVTSVALPPGAALRPPPQHTVRVIRVAFHRPFGFLVVDRSSSLVLVAGWLENPLRHPDAEEFESGEAWSLLINRQ